jgi:class 3 adenylate cyclase/tetratricopeptide (TPR) repeat protein
MRCARPVVKTLAVPHPRSHLQATSPPVIATMARCAACNTANDDGLRFCGECGAKLPETCASCGFVNPPAFKYCGQCGSALTLAVGARPGTPAAAATSPPERDAERRQITVLFCDLVGSTELAERLDPEELREVIREYQAVAAAVITSAGGHIAQYLGDGMLVYFGYPTAHEDDARRAIHAGLGIVQAVATLGERLQHDRGVRLSVRCGIHTGAVVAGEMGAGPTTERLAVGSAPNVAARLQGMAAAGDVLLSGATRAIVRGWFDLEPLGPTRLRGIANPIDVYRAVRESGEASRSELDRARRLSPLVGRQEELALIMRRLHLAREGAGQVVLISGEAGVGKSRLVQVLTEQAAAEGFMCLVSRCESYYQNSSLHPIIGLMESRLGFERDDAGDVRLRKLEDALTPLGVPLADSVPLLAALLSVPISDQYAPLNLFPHKQKERTLELLFSLLVRTAEQQPVVFIMEDVHWADPSTHEFLALLVSRPPVPRMLSLMTTRAEFQVTWAARSNVTVVSLNRLDDREVRAMIEAMAGSRRLPAEVVNEVVKRTDGVPVFVEELTTMVLESGLDESEGRPPMAERLLALAIPATLRDSLLARLDRMAEAKEVAQLGAVLGREFSYELLRAVSGISDDRLEAHLRRLVDAELLYQRGSAPNAIYSFKHALIQDAAVELLLKSTRRQFHRRTAEALAAGFPAEAAAHPEVLGHHFAEAGLNEQAIGAWLQAGMLSLRRSANQEAVAQLRRGLACVSELAASPMRDGMELAVLATLGPAYIVSRGWAAPETVEVYDRASALGERMPDAPELFWAIRGLWLNAFVRGELDRALELGQRCMRLAEAANVAELLMEGHYSIGCAHLFRGEQVAAREHFEWALALDHPGRDLSPMYFTALDVLTSSLSLYALALWLTGDTDQAERESAKAVALAETLAHPNSIAFALYQNAVIHYANGDRRRVREICERVVAMSVEQGLPMEFPARVLAGWATDSVEDTRTALETEYAHGSTVGLPQYLACLAAVQLRRGLAADARASVDRALESAAQTQSHMWDAELYRLLGDAALAAGHADQADAAYRQALGVAQHQGATTLAARASESLSITSARTS